MHREILDEVTRRELLAGFSVPVCSKINLVDGTDYTLVRRMTEDRHSEAVAIPISPYAAEFLFSSALVVKAGVDLRLPANDLHFEDGSLPARRLACVTHLFAAAPLRRRNRGASQIKRGTLTQEREEV
jgi:hypothetical protein